MLLDPLSLPFVHVAFAVMGALVMLVIFESRRSEPVKTAAKPKPGEDVVTTAPGFDVNGHGVRLPFTHGKGN